MLDEHSSTLGSRYRFGTDVDATKQLMVDIVAAEEPIWLDDDLFESAVVDPPTALVDLGLAAGISSSESGEIVRRAFCKFDSTARLRLGSAGEESLCELLRRAGADEVVKVSDFDDSAGYDIHVRHEDSVWHLEVKSTLKRRSVRFYLSRNELETSRRDGYWCLILVGLDESHSLMSVATIDREFIYRNSPSNRTAVSRWESASFRCSVADLRPVRRLGSLEIDAGNADWWF